MLVLRGVDSFGCYLQITLPPIIMVQFKMGVPPIGGPFQKKAFSTEPQLWKKDLGLHNRFSVKQLNIINSVTAL